MAQKKKPVTRPKITKPKQKLPPVVEIEQHRREEKVMELRLSQAELEDAYRQYSDLYDFAPIGYFTLARNGAIHQVNLAGANLLGVNHKEATQLRLAAFISNKSQTTFNIFFEKLLSGKGKEICELAFDKKGGELLWARLEATCFEGGAVSRVMLTDITERKRAEKALEATNIELKAALAREKKLAHTDMLTGVHNRRNLYEIAAREFDIATRYQQPLSMMLFDLDHFKKVNDTFGHMAGDQILVLVTQAACAELRSADAIGRYGGEEFVIVLSMTNAQQAYSLAERIRKSVATLRVSTPLGDATVTISVGIFELAQTSTQVQTVDDMIRCADQAMYAAKQAGRNCTIIFNPDITSHNE